MRDPRPRRALEHAVRRAVATCTTWARRAGLASTRVAAALGLSARTVRAWTRHRGGATRGRPAYRLSLEEQRVLRVALALDHGRGSVRQLQPWCPAASRRALVAWLREDRQRARRRLHRVMWTGVGRVWAVDWSAAPTPIDGRYRWILHVRDLASQYHLAALPVPRVTARVLCDLLRALCARTSAPLVLKLDNGSAGASHSLAAWASRVGTVPLYSPPRWPRYNGTIEASIGAIATRAHHAAAAHAHPGDWTTDDVEAARADANATRRRGHPDGTAAVAWQRASPIRPRERRRFLAEYARQLRRLPSDQTASVRRRLAIVHTLGVLGYVSITRRGR